MEQVGADVTQWRDRAETFRHDGASVMFLAVDGRVAGLLTVADPIKESAQPTLEALRRSGLHVVMATGDGETTARAVASRLGIDEFHGEVSPADKAQLVRALQAQGRQVAMAGDGINDAPALAAADVGVAMGTGTDVAMSSAQVTLVKGDLRGICARASCPTPRCATCSRTWIRLRLQRMGVPIAAGVLYPVFHLLLSPMIAALAMSLSSVSVVANALRLGVGAGATRTDSR
jgi:Cu+-exporting ATPase